MSGKCQITNMDGNHRVIENDHILVAIVHNYWEYSVFSLSQEFKKRGGPSVTSPLSFY